MIRAIKKLSQFYLVFGLGFVVGVAFASFFLGVLGVGRPPDIDQTPTTSAFR